MKDELKAIMRDHAAHQCQVGTLLLEADELVATLRNRVTMKEDVALRALCVILEQLVDAVAMDHSDTAYHLERIGEILSRRDR